MSRQSIEMNAYLERAKAGDAAALARIRTYMVDHVFVLFGEDRLSREDQAEILMEDDKCLGAFSLVIDHIEEAGSLGSDSLPDIRVVR